MIRLPDPVAREWVTYDDRGNEVSREPITPEEWAELAPDPVAVEAANEAARSARVGEASVRAALTAVLALAEAYPYPTPEETAIVDAQASAALDGFRALADPPADVVALAAAVVSWRATA
jgi:hypothetical protein